MGAKFSVFVDRIRKRMKKTNVKDLNEKMKKVILEGLFQTPRATEDEVIKQLQEEGIIPTVTRHGGVAFEVPLEGGKPRTRAPRRLAHLSTPRKSMWSREEKKLIAGIYKEEHLDQLRKTARKEEEKRRKNAERKVEQQILLQKSRAQKFFRKMAAAEGRQKELTLQKKRVLPPTDLSTPESSK